MSASAELAWMRRQTLLSLLLGDFKTARARYGFWRALSRFNRLMASRVAEKSSNA